MNGTGATPSAAFLAVSRELLASGYKVRFQANGSSMYPTIRDKERITLASTETSAIRKGDIVLYGLGQGVIAHRVRRIERSPDGAPILRLRGDAADADDSSTASKRAVFGSVWVVVTAALLLVLVLLLT